MQCSMGARHEALMLDPVYTGKAMAGFIQRANQARPGRYARFRAHRRHARAVCV